MAYKYIFGPVFSNRLGLSLGLDLLGDKICSYDCLYCESGPTSIKSIKRRPYVPGQDILQEFEHWWRHAEYAPEHITLGGVGEPCLNSDLGLIVSGVKKIAPDVPLAILTNSSLLGSSLIRKELAKCQVLLPSLDSLLAREFWVLNRPVVDMDPGRIAENILTARKEFKGHIYLEVLLVRGLNDSEQNLNKMQEFCTELQANRVDVMTMSRPGAHAQARPVQEETLQLWRESLGAFSGTDKDCSVDPGRTGISTQQLRNTVLNTLHRRPQTLEQMSAALNVHQSLLHTVLQDLLQRKAVYIRELGHLKFFMLTRE